MKYIDAEKLKTELNKRIELLENGDAHSEVMKRVEGTVKGYKATLTIIDSLEQEEKVDNRWQPCDEHFRALEYAIEYFKKKKNDTTYLEDLYNGLNTRK